MHPDRTALLAANWKAHQDWAACERFAAELADALPEFGAETAPPLELLVCPPLPYLHLLGSLLHDNHVLLGAQDVSRHKSGPFTGEVTAEMLADSGADYCIVGHSERRAMGETDEVVRAKVARLRSAEVIPLICVGESRETREMGIAEQFVLDQLEQLRAELTELPGEEIVVAYEPIWAIGTGLNAEPADAQLMAAAIRGWLSGLSAEHGFRGLVLYGGSVNPDNLGACLEQPDIDGALIGGASLEAGSLAQMTRIALELRSKL